MHLVWYGTGIANLPGLDGIKCADHYQHQGVDEAYEIIEPLDAIAHEQLVKRFCWTVKFDLRRIVQQPGNIDDYFNSHQAEHHYDLGAGGRTPGLQ